MAACESIGTDAAHCEKNCPQRIKFAWCIRFGHDRQGSDAPEWKRQLFGNCFSQINIQIWIIMACPSLNIEKLINLVQNYQFLYDKSHKYYCNNIIRENVWTEISNSLDTTTGNYMILYSVIYILRSFCNILQYENHTIMTFHNEYDNFNN